MIHLVISFQGHLDETVLEKSVLEALAAEPLACARFIPVEPPRLEFAGDIPESPSWAVIRSERPADQIMKELLSSSLDPLKGPMVRIRLIRSDEDRLCISFNHTITDAYGVKSFASIVARLYRSKISGGIFFPLENLQDRSFCTLLSLYTGVKPKDLLTSVGRKDAAWNIPFTSLMQGKREYAVNRIGKDLFSGIRDYARLHGITINDILLSSYVLALAELGSSRASHNSLTLLTSMDLRRYLSPDGYPSVANLSVALELPVTIQEERDPQATVRQIHRMMSEYKSGHAGLKAALHLCNDFKKGFTEAEKRYSSLDGQKNGVSPGKPPFFTNLGVIPESVVDYGIPVTMAWMHAPVEFPPGFCLAASTFRDCISLSAGYPGEALEGEWVESLLSCMGLNLEKLIARQ